MNKKQFEHIESKFREAAENYQPPVTPEAWQRMEKLLDNKFNEKRRPAGLWLWLLLLLIVTGATGIVIYSITPGATTAGKNTTVQKENGKGPATELLKENTATATPGAGNRENRSGTRASGKQVPLITEPTVKQNDVTQDNKPAVKTSDPGTFSPEKASTSGGSRRKAVATKSLNRPAGNRDRVAEDHRSISVEQLQRQLGIEEEQSKPSPKRVATKREAAIAEEGTVTANVKTKDSQVSGLKKPATVSGHDGVTVTNKRSTLPVAEMKHQQVSVPEISSRLYFIASLASDANAVKGGPVSYVSALYGVGIGYNLNQRFSIQTGVYSGSKRYAADSTNYYRKPGYWRMVKIKNIDADCYVINVPLSIRYNVSPNTKGQFYAIAGLSSYFMQKEAYHYAYSYRSMDSLHYRTEVYGDNKHWMSVLDLSFGYERKLSKRVSIQGEPYLKMPLKGVGEGRVHLYSAGFMVGLKCTPY